MKELLDNPQQKTTTAPARRAPPPPAAYNLPAPVAAPNSWGPAPPYAAPAAGVALPYPINPTASGMPMYPWQPQLLLYVLFQSLRVIFKKLYDP